MRTFHLVPLFVALLAASPATAPRRTGTCRTVDSFSLHFKSWISHTVRDTSWYALESRNAASLPYLPSANVGLVSESGACGTLALQFARTIPGRDTVKVNDVIVVSVDSAYYLVTDLGGGPSNVFRRNPDGSTTVQLGRSDFVDAITIDRALVTTTAWKWEHLAGRPVPY